MEVRNKATSIDLFSLKTRQMRAFHMSWFSFFLCFFAWLGIAPLMAVVVHIMGAEVSELLGNNLSFQFTLFIFFTLLLLIWRGSGPFSLDHLLRMDFENEPELFND